MTTKQKERKYVSRLQQLVQHSASGVISAMLDNPDPTVQKNLAHDCREAIIERLQECADNPLVLPTLQGLFHNNALHDLPPLIQTIVKEYCKLVAAAGVLSSALRGPRKQDANPMSETRTGKDKADVLLDRLEQALREKKTQAEKNSVLESFMKPPGLEPKPVVEPPPKPEDLCNSEPAAGSTPEAVPPAAPFLRSGEPLGAPAPGDPA